MPAEPLSGITFLKLMGIVFGPLLAIFAAAFGFMWKKQENAVRDNSLAHSELKSQLYREYATKKHVETYVTLVIKPIIDSIDRLAESNKELAQELREQRKRE